MVLFAGMYPTPQEYNEALQNPRLALGDAELKSGTPETDALGLPRARSGNFACVYKLLCRHSSGGERAWAVRCFLVERTDLRERYAAISAHLRRVKLPYTVEFEYLQPGILVRGTAFPILKMEWLQGDSLATHVSKHLRNPAALLALAEKWVRLTLDLQRAGIAHGDLQHGNILVVNGALRLIDYDGMFVPGLSGRISHEIGHRNYQHPERGSADFAPYVDNFSAWVIYVSLVTLSVHPELWSQFNGGDECLLFRRADFVRPAASPILRMLASSRDVRLRQAILRFEALLGLSPREIPLLDGSASPSVAASAATPPKSAARPSWIEDHIQIKPSEKSASSPPPPVPVPEPEAAPELTPFGEAQAPGFAAAGHPSWILDFLQPAAPAPAPVTFRNPPLGERIAGLVALATALAGFAAAQAAVAIPLAVLLAALYTLVLYWRFSRDPALRELRPLLGEKRALDSRVAESREFVESLSRRRENCDKRVAELRRKLVEEPRAIYGVRDQGIRRVWEGFQKELAAVNEMIGKLDAQERQQLERYRKSLDIDAVEAALREIAPQIARDLAETLARLQGEFVDAFLSGRSVLDQEFKSIPLPLRAALHEAGYRSAAEINLGVQDLPGIGRKRAQALMAWRNSVLLEARAGMPASLSSAEAAAVRARYHTRFAELRARKLRLEQDLRAEEGRIRKQYGDARQVFRNKLAATQKKVEDEIEHLTRIYERQADERRRAATQSMADTERARNGLERQLAEHNKRLFNLSWKVLAVERKIGAFGVLSFKGYVRRTLAM